MLTINIEPTNICNASCFYCINSTNHANLHQKNFLPLEIHNKIFDELKFFINDFSCAPTFDKSIYLRYCGVGEPSLHPDLIDMLKESINFPEVKQIAVLSNGAGWDKETVDKFTDLPALQVNKQIELIFSLDTLSSKTQFKIKKLDNIYTIIKQLLYLIAQKRKKNLNNLHIIVQMIILKENISEVNDFCRFWEKIFTEHKISSKIVSTPDYTKYLLTNDCFIWLKCLDSDRNKQKAYIDLHKTALKKIVLCPLGNKEENTFINENESPAINHKQQNFKTSCICGILWYGMMISANADVSPCCSDINFELKIGNIKNNSLVEIYKSETMRHLRLNHIKGNLRNYPICKNCNILYRGTPVIPEDINEYLNIINGKEINED